MDRSGVVNQIRGVIEEYLKSNGLELVDIIFRFEGGDLFLRILADRPEGGINLDECAAINSQVGRVLEEKDIVQQRYILEVSSPGLDRPLRTKNDFRRCLNKNAKFFLREMVEGKLEWDGIILTVSDASVEIDSAGRSLVLPLEQITKAKLLF